MSTGVDIAICDLVVLAVEVDGGTHLFVCEIRDTAATSRNGILNQSIEAIRPDADATYSVVAGATARIFYYGVVESLRINRQVLDGECVVSTDEVLRHALVMHIDEGTGIPQQRDVPLRHTLQRYKWW